MEGLTLETKYTDFLEQSLKLPNDLDEAPLVLDLFAGCGGLALGFESAGFKTSGYEILNDACNTYNKNLHGTCHEVYLTPETGLQDDADVIIGGPPCQPFSVIGKQLGNKDKRDGFPSFLSAISRYNPKLALFENVRGMLYRNRQYLDDIVNKLERLTYIVEFRILHSEHYGVPQKRERLFVVAHRGLWTFPKNTTRIPYSAGDAIKDLCHEVPPNAKFLTKSMDEYIAKYEKKSKCRRPRDLDLLTPCRTITCRNLVGATSDMLRIKHPDGRRRRLTVREAARLQAFPDWFEFCGSEMSQLNQIGNAVPPLLGKAIACSVKEYFESNFQYSKSEIEEINRGRKKNMNKYG